MKTEIFQFLLIFIGVQITWSTSDAQKPQGTNEVVKSNSAARKLDGHHKGAHHHIIYGKNGTEIHKKSWMALPQVDGLKNEEVAMFVTSTNNFEGAFLRERIIPSSRTWMRFFANVFVIVEDTFDIRFSLRNCEVSETEHFTYFACHNEATYVLSRKCTNEYYGAAGPCCKVDDAFTFLLNDRPEFAATIKYALHCDDDTYWRADLTLKWLAAIENSGASSFPITANPEAYRANWPGIWHIENCKEIETNGWYQPLMVNAAAMKLMKNSVANNGIQSTCKAFDVTHDVGFGVYAWLFGMYQIQMPHCEVNGGHMVVHYLKPFDTEKCREVKSWPDNIRHDQKMVIGCGDIDRPGPFHEKKVHAMMYDAWEYYREHGTDTSVTDQFVDAQVTMFPASATANGTTPKVQIKHILTDKEKPDASGKFKGDPVETRKIPHLRLLGGYSNTEHGKKNDIVKSWVPFTMKDCSPPGSVQK